jgi:hypothetical protein
MTSRAYGEPPLPRSGLAARLDDLAVTPPAPAEAPRSLAEHLAERPTAPPRPTVLRAPLVARRRRGATDDGVVVTAEFLGWSLRGRRSAVRWTDVLQVGLDGDTLVLAVAGAAAGATVVRLDLPPSLAYLVAEEADSRLLDAREAARPLRAEAAG